MQAPAIPADDAQRLQALRELLILDTPPEERFDRIARFAAEEFEVESALVNLVDADRQWTKASSGERPADVPRAESFCSHTILQPETLEVEDASLDPRFHDNPMVTGAPHLRFYAGAPLRLRNGATVGAFCLSDSRPRRLDRIGHAILTTLRDLVVEELERRQQEGA